MIIAGLDNWYVDKDGGTSGIDLQEYQIEEWRLQNALDVDNFRLPPDYRQAFGGSSQLNSHLSVPALRFPCWHVCPRCHRMYEAKLSQKEPVYCDDCSTPRRKIHAESVGIVAICDQGHLQDFPWRDWVHKSHDHSCSGDLKLFTSGGSSLSSRSVRCSCGARRNLWQIQMAYPDGSTYLTNNLRSDGMTYCCKGHQPWNYQKDPKGCDRSIRGAFSSAANLYYADIHSAIYLPRGANAAPPELIRFISEPHRQYLRGIEKSVCVNILRNENPIFMHDYTDKQIAASLEVIWPSTTAKAQKAIEPPISSEDSTYTQFRRDEFEVLRKERDDDQLLIKKADMASYESEIAGFFSRVMLVHTLRETRVLAGFSRVYPPSAEQSQDERKALLWQHPDKAERWLPAYTVKGEGIYIEFDENRMQAWEHRPEVIEHFRELMARYRKAFAIKRAVARPLGPRFVALHTFAHILMNQLSFECGYATASLRERLYIDDSETNPMAGILIYTAAGDSEGTLGGLVRLGKPGHFEQIIKRALVAAQWCSADPICMEIGLQGGQGPDSLNLAACHSCALLPETSCEEFNRFLDRGALIGTPDEPDLGYFQFIGHAVSPSQNRVKSSTVL